MLDSDPQMTADMSGSRGYSSQGDNSSPQHFMSSRDRTSQSYFKNEKQGAKVYNTGRNLTKTRTTTVPINEVPLEANHDILGNTDSLSGNEIQNSVAKSNAAGPSLDPLPEVNDDYQRISKLRKKQMKGNYMECPKL